jgi:hypothetical protein
MKHETYEHGPFVEAWLKEPTWLPQTDLARVRQIVHQTPQRRSRLPRLATERFRPMFSATTIAASVAVVALTGGVLMGGLLPQPTPNEQLPAAAVEATAATGPDAAETAPDENAISLPETLPAGVEGGSIDTPAGPVRWVHIRGSREDVPMVHEVIDWGDGIAAWHPAWGFWATEDGVAWQSLPLPDGEAPRMDIGAVEVRQAGDVAYAISLHTDRVWRSTDDGSWQELDAAALASARPSGWQVTDANITVGPNLSDGRVIFGAGWGYSLPRAELGITEKGTQRMKHVTKNRFALCGKNDCTKDQYSRVLRFRPTDDGLVVFDQRSGTRLGLLAGATRDQVYRGEGGSSGYLFEIVGDTVVRAGQPLPSTIARPSDAPPPGLPSGAAAAAIGSGWYAEGEDGGWLHAAGEWISLEPLGLPGRDEMATPVPAGGYGSVPRLEAGGIGNVTLLARETPQGDEIWRDLWVLVLSEDA